MGDTSMDPWLDTPSPASTTATMSASASPAMSGSGMGGGGGGGGGASHAPYGLAPIYEPTGGAGGESVLFQSVGPPPQGSIHPSVMLASNSGMMAGSGSYLGGGGGGGGGVSGSGNGGGGGGGGIPLSYADGSGAGLASYGLPPGHQWVAVGGGGVGGLGGLGGGGGLAADAIMGGELTPLGYGRMGVPVQQRRTRRASEAEASLYQSGVVDVAMGAGGSHLSPRSRAQRERSMSLCEPPVEPRTITQHGPALRTSLEPTKRDKKKRSSSDLSLGAISLGDYNDQHDSNNKPTRRRRSTDAGSDAGDERTKKETHNQAEKKRRIKLNELVFELHALLPKNKCIPVQKPAVISYSIEYINELRSMNAALRSQAMGFQMEMDRLRAMNMELSQRLAQLEGGEFHDPNHPHHAQQQQQQQLQQQQQQQQQQQLQQVGATHGLVDANGNVYEIAAAPPGFVAPWQLQQNWNGAQAAQGQGFVQNGVVHPLDGGVDQSMADGGQVTTTTSSG